MAIVILQLVRLLVLAIVFHRTKDVPVRYHTRKISTYVAVAIGFFVIGRLWFVGFTDIGTFVGLLSAGLAIALRDLIASIAGWAYILWRRPFEVGDRIQVGEHAGDVIDQRLFRLTLIKIGNWVDECGILLTIRYLCEPRKRRTTEEVLWENILREFKKCDDIDFAYPTMRRYINSEEGKPKTGGPVNTVSESPTALPVTKGN